MLTQDEVRQIAHKYADLVRQKYDPTRIILFGSQVNGTPHEYSDIDIAVIFNGFMGDRRKTIDDLWKIRNNIIAPIEPHLLDETSDPSGFVEHVVETGEVIYKGIGVDDFRPERKNMDELVEYWIEQCDDDLKRAKVMLSVDDYSQVAFYVHLTLEKALKAVIASQTLKLPPRTHKLTDLVKFTGLEHDLSAIEYNLLQRMNDMHVDSTYPPMKKTDIKLLTKDECDVLVQETTDFLAMIKKRLGNSETSTH